MTWLIDEQGEVWPRRMHPTSQWSEQDRPLEYAVVERGFVHVVQKMDIVEVILRFSRMQTATACGLFRALSGIKRNRLVIFEQISPSLCSVAHFFNLSDALYYIWNCVQEYAIPALMIEKSLRLDDANLPKRLENAVRIWTDTGRADWTTATATAQFQDHSVVVRRPRKSDRLIYQHWGTSVDLNGSRRWIELAAGKEVFDQPFPQIAATVAKTVRRTLADGRPVLHEVWIQAPAAEGKRVNRHYQRLLLPWVDGNGDERVTGVMSFNPRSCQSNDTTIQGHSGL